MSTPRTFHPFPNLPSELQVSVISHAMAYELERNSPIALPSEAEDKPNSTPRNLIKITCPPAIQNPRGSNPPHFDRIPDLSNTHIILAKPPTLYHVNQFFRTESVGLQPLSQTFEDVKSILDTRGSMILFKPKHDNLALDVINMDYDFERLRHITTFLAPALQSQLRSLSVRAIGTPGPEDVVIGRLCDAPFPRLRTCYAETRSGRLGASYVVQMFSIPDVLPFSVLEITTTCEGEFITGSGGET